MTAPPEPSTRDRRSGALDRAERATRFRDDDHVGAAAPCRRATSAHDRDRGSHDQRFGTGNGGGHGSGCPTGDHAGEGTAS